MSRRGSQVPDLTPFSGSSSHFYETSDSEQPFPSSHANTSIFPPSKGVVPSGIDLEDVGLNEVVYWLRSTPLAKRSKHSHTNRSAGRFVMLPARPYKLMSDSWISLSRCSERYVASYFVFAEANGAG